jgi:hypothetical protein
MMGLTKFSLLGSFSFLWICKMIITQTPQTCRSLICNVTHKIHHQITHRQSTRYMHGHKQKMVITLQASCAL